MPWQSPSKKRKKGRPVARLDPAAHPIDDEYRRQALALVKQAQRQGVDMNGGMVVVFDPASSNEWAVELAVAGRIQGGANEITARQEVQAEIRRRRGGRWVCASWMMADEVLSLFDDFADDGWRERVLGPQPLGEVRMAIIDAGGVKFTSLPLAS
jgi:hypothetical protein